MPSKVKPAVEFLIHLARTLKSDAKGKKKNLHKK